MPLYIGTNYHPHDWPEERWPIDIAMMKEAGFTTVRLGHLCWDSYEPEEGVYTFEWFDRVMDLFAEAGIGVFLDISLRPAPAWVHRLCPGCNIYGKSGTPQASLRRYMEDISDPGYQHYALRFAETFVERYRENPALFAFGLCNEVGDGYISHSEYSRNRFAEWLRIKYKTIDALNEAWAARRWSRRISCFEDAALPENETAIGPPEAWLDMRRFWSDAAGSFLVSLKGIAARKAPGVPHSSNHYAEKSTLGFDYLKYCDSFTDFPGIGFYCPYDMSDAYLTNQILYTQRLAETGKPMWCLEFQTGTKGLMCGPWGAVRRYAFLCLLNRAQMILGWTWRTMLGGEEQYLYGMLSHDGRPTQNYYEYCRIAADMKKLQEYGFPYIPRPEIAVAFSYDSSWVSQYSPFQFRMGYGDSMLEAARLFFNRNTDYNVVDLRNMKGSYKLLIVPEHIVMDQESADTLRRFIENGGTAVMTGYSAAVDETGKVFGIPRPGLLDDVFGIRVSGHRRSSQRYFFSEDARTEESGGELRELLQIISGGENFEISADYYELLELTTAEEIAGFGGKDLCAVSCNRYGRGCAVYTAVETNEVLLGWLLKKLAPALGLEAALDVPEGIQARKIADGQYFYVNTTEQEIRVPLGCPGRGVLTGRDYNTELTLAAYDGELVITETGQCMINS